MGLAGLVEVPSSSQDPSVVSPRRRRAPQGVEPAPQAEDGLTLVFWGLGCRGVRFWSLALGSQETEAENGQ